MYIPESESRHPVYDKLPDENYPIPISRERIAEFQSKLDKIAGIAPNGRSNVRLIWAADPDESVSMIMINGEKRAKYRLYTEEYDCIRMHGDLEVIERIDVDICTPRFMIEEYHLPDEEAFARAPDGHEGKGHYTHLFSVAYHDEECCSGREALRGGQLCLGLYREPCEADLEELRRRIKLRDELVADRRIGERPSYVELVQSLRDIKYGHARKEEKRTGLFEEMFADGMKTHSHRIFSDDPAVHSHGKYHFIDKRRIKDESVITDAA